VAVGGLDNFDEEEAAQNLAAVGQPLPDVSVEMEGPPRVFDAQGNVMPPDAASPPIADVTPIEAEQAAGAPTVSAAPPLVAGAPEAQAPVTSGQAPPVGPAPEPVRPGPPPALSGDAAKDTQNNILYQRQWHDYADQQNARHVEEKNRIAAVQAEQAGAEAKLARAQAAEASTLRKQQAAEREQNRATIAEAVKEKIAAAGDLDGFRWDKPYTGGQIAAIIAGAFAQGLQNMGAIYAGHAPTAQNEAFKLIDTRMAQEYQARKEKYARAGDALLQARYGFKDAEDNQRAAQNDLNAEQRAKWLLIKKDGEEQARRAGIPEAEIQNLLLVAGAGQKAAEHEGDILQREEGHADQRNQAAATLKLAEANLGVRKLAERDTHLDRVASREDRAAAAREAAAAKKEKTAEKEDTTAVRDENGNVIGHVPTGRGGAQGFATRDADYARGEEQLEALLDDVVKHGSRVVDPAKAKRRDALYKNALGGVVTVSPMGKTNEAMEIEKGSIGESGGLTPHSIGGAVVGANPEAIARKIKELRTQRERYRKEVLIPVKGAVGSAAPATKKIGGAVYEYVPDDEAP